MAIIGADHTPAQQSTYARCSAIDLNVDFAARSFLSTPRSLKKAESWESILVRYALVAIGVNAFLR
jgi:hypothetical protein